MLNMYFSVVVLEVIDEVLSTCLMSGGATHSTVRLIHIAQRR